MAEGRSKVDDVQRLLRADILNGKLVPGSKLAFAELRLRYNCSVGVLREALPRLVGEGLAVSEPQLGFRVVSVTVDDLRHLTEARVIIEAMVLRQAIAEGGVSYEAQVVAAHHVLASEPMFLPDGSVSPAWVSAHSGFHRALLEACTNDRLRNIANSLRDSAEVYRCWSGTVRDQHGRDIRAEHQRIADHVLAGDADAAAAALADHIEQTTEILLRSLDAAATVAADEGRQA
jgi:DNA-binding GntR family transcriptional regulator